MTVYSLAKKCGLHFRTGRKLKEVSVSDKRGLLDMKGHFGMSSGTVKSTALSSLSGSLKP